MKRPVAAAVGAITAIGVYLLTQGVLSDILHGSRDETSMEFLSKVANEVNKNCPMMVNGETELMNTVGLDGVIVYNYRLVNTSKDDVDPDVFIDSLRAQVTQQACTTPETRDNLLKDGITMRFAYHDKNRSYLASLDVTMDDCDS